MATMTATTNAQYYSSYPSAQNLGNMSTVNQYPPQAYGHHTSSHHHHHLQQQHQQQVQQQQSYQQPQQQQQQLAPTSMPLNQQHHQTQLTQLNTASHQSQRTISASSNSSSAANALYNSIEATKSTKGASKLRRDLINTEIAQLRELLPLPASTRQRLSQLQLMALVLVYVRKSNYFCNAFRNYGISREPSLSIPTSGFSKALNGFLMMLTQKGKLLYISDNAAEYLGHSMEDLLSHGDEVYDIIEDQDKKIIRTELLSNEDESQSSPSSKSLHHHQQQQAAQLPSTETRIALCRMNVSRNARRQMRFGDQKVVLIEGHYFGFLPLSSRDEPVFLATCTPIAMPETRECVVQGSTNVFTSIHSMDMKFLYIDSVGEHHLGYTKQQIHGKSWYDLVHFEHLHEAQAKHRRITATDQERSTIVLLRLMNLDTDNTIWVHSVMQVKEASDSSTQPVIVCTNQVLSKREAQVMRSNSWLYQFYSLHSKAHCNFSSSSPSLQTGNGQTSIGTPNSVCSDSATGLEAGDVKPAAAAINALAASSDELLGLSSAKSPLAATDLIGVESPPIGGKAAPDGSTFTALQNYTGFTGGSSGPANYSQMSHQNGSMLKTPTASKLSPLTNSPSSASTMSSSPLSSSSSYLQQQQQQQQSQAARYHQLTSSGTNQGFANPSSLVDLATGHHQHHQAPIQQIHHHSNNSLGASSASSTSSSSSSSSSSASSTSESSTTPNGTATSSAQSLAVAGSAAAAAAAGLYAGIDAATAAAAIDPLHQHMQHAASATHHHQMYSTASNSGQHHHSAAVAAAHHHTQAAAAVNYANQVMAAQRVAHHHHHPYHPYHHHQHHPVHAGHHHNQSAGHHAGLTAVAPHHHNHHTAPPHALYASAAPAHHHHHHQPMAASAASSAALNSAFNHHHHHHHHAAAYHSAAAVAAVSAHPAAHHHSSNSAAAAAVAASALQSSYHPAASAAAAAAAAHQGVSFHYNKIAAAVNASA